MSLGFAFERFKINEINKQRLGYEKLNSAVEMDNILRGLMMAGGVNTWTKRLDAPIRCKLFAMKR